ncbi:hypothetical protein GGI07_000381 [Coemansia sp. Benny D115]|nr:hypothetical protein GGI07_000381 [Coemansia sp. Benny D115]
MVKLYYEYTGDKDFVRDSMPLLIREHKYWMDNNLINVQTTNGNYTLNRYVVDTDQPRPESYSDDYELAHSVSSSPDRQAKIYADMAAGAESGWDYTVRWVKDPHAAPEKVLQGINTSNVVPVDLNSILYQVEETLSEFARMLQLKGDTDKYRRIAKERKAAIKSLFYDSASGLYYDYLLDSAKKSNVFSVASIWPYWAFGSNSSDSFGAKNAYSYIAKVLTSNPGGIPSTLINSGQQWDWPMAWPPLQYVVMQGALATKNTAVAGALAQAYVNSVFCAWYNTGGSIPNILAQLPNQTDSGHIFEKFNSVNPGQQGGGGEYTVQAGFGWTNGVLLWTLDKFGKVLKTPVCPGTELHIMK